jgi:hypothetical protein
MELFVDWLMELPEGLKREFKAELNQYEQEKQMRYVSSIERMAIEDTQIATAMKMLEDEVPLETIVRYTGLSIEKVLELRSRQGSGQ